MTISGGFTQTANVRPTTHAEVLLAVVSKIQFLVPSFSTDGTCFISDSPWPGVEVSDNLFCTVAPADGQFDDGLIDGAGNVGVAEETFVQVTVYSRIDTDQTEHFLQGMVDSERGLLTLKQQLLTALAGKNLDGGTYQGDGSMLLHEGMRPARAGHKSRNDKSDEFASFSLAFRVKFTWDLGGTSNVF